MNLAPAFKTIVSVAGATGAVSAVSVPLTLTRGSSTVTDKLNIVSCDGSVGDNNRELVSFGDKDSLSVCWSVEKPQGEGSVQQVASVNSQELSSLFAHKWNRGTESWKNDSSTHWLQQCTDSESGWVILTTEGSAEYLGLCNSANQEGIPFIKKEGQVGEDSSVVKLYVCSTNCWAKEELSNSTKVFKAEKAGSWNSVSFYRN
ncbi:hypothetical protein [Candidatus Mycoplasma haematominutum]|uniref:Uncharacterized protein n=1 Tax=Candidatus Mycoplasma haematominutum 'Birmingham 1' TaxID=1116213 RepID=G8C3P4_9MOLU|nr:hypothetical protein [Candidatus Mycoplasma haematominutum]CCE66942.1 hypothetical protein MHM_04240 [Candidatus Mycoplasma haematominutum 'Birmingham 1']